jgi:hypothetical protein
LGQESKKPNGNLYSGLGRICAGWQGFDCAGDESDNGWVGRGGLICECNVLKIEQALPFSGKACSIMHRKNVLTDDCFILPMESAKVTYSERIA